MVLTRRAYKSISRWLPNELLSRIMEASSSSDLAALCRTCKLFHAIGTPALYRVVYLRSDSVECFCSTVLGNTAKFADLVRSFTTDPKLLRDPSPLVLSCVKTLARIENISINGNQLQEARHEVMYCTFPDLLRCVLSLRDRDWTSLQQEDTVASFLIRHPGLQSVEIIHSWAPDFWPSTSARIPLLNLERISAPSRFLPSIIARGLKEVRLEWLQEDPVEPVFSILGSMTRSNVPFVYSNFCWGDYCTEIVDSMSRNVPHAKTLYMYVYALDPMLREETIAQFMKSLPRFTKLQSFGIQTKGGDKRRSTFGVNEVEDQITVQGFGDVCSTLQICRLNENAWRKIDGTWELFPFEKFSASAGITFFS
ncbi:hypothetical protein DFH06DRAFT_1312652 [Mycena polygramma]|nr:hypothetical protein DFH06DRAFT_1312652 [Mycena polygramma]